jgi:hypothetical protein
LETEELTKKCSKCGKVKPRVGFYSRARNFDGLTEWCKECFSARRQADVERKRARRARATPEEKRYNRNKFLLNRYGISADDYDKMYSAQLGRCYICFRTPQEAGHRGTHEGRLMVDHCHTTNRVRQLLCNNCNKELGWYEKNLKRAAVFDAYLKNFQETSREVK